MPTLPLYSPDAAPDASHGIISPGGYEHWTFAADAADRASHVAITFAHGFALHPRYLRAYARYRRRPTRVLPPVPNDYICVLASVYQGGHPGEHFAAHYPAGSFSAASDRLDLQIGRNRCRVQGDGAIHVIVEMLELSADLHFAPRAAPAPSAKPFDSAGNRPDHFRSIGRPWCGVTGTVKAPGFGARPLQFDGGGYHDHHYGIAPIAPGLNTWLRGTAMFGDCAFAFELRKPHATGHPIGVQLLRCENGQIQEIPNVVVRAHGYRRATFSGAFPAELDFGDALKLIDPRVIGQSPFGLLVRYAASTAEGHTTPSICQFAFPRRVCAPLTGRMIERSIRKMV